MRVTVLLDSLPRAWRRWTFACAEAVFLVYSVVVCWLGVVITQQSVARGRILSSTEWPLGVLYAAIILSGALSAARLAHSLWRVVRHGDDHLAPHQDI